MATIIAKGTQFEIKNIAISTELKAISFDHAVNELTLRARGNTEFRVYAINYDGDNAEYWTVEANEIFTLNVRGKEKDTTACWVRTTAGTDTLECIGVF